MNKHLIHNQVVSIIEQVNGLCAELFRNTPISNFYYYRISRTREFITIGTNAQAHDFYINNQHFNKQFQHRSYDKNIPNGAFFFDSVYTSPDEIHINKIYQDNFDIANVVGIPRKEKEYCDVYAFATSKTVKNAKNFFLNNIDLLEKFVDVFRQPLNSIIVTHSKKIYIPGAKTVEESGFNDEKINFPEVVSRALTANEIKLTKNAHLILTNREFICLRHMSQGLTAKEIARILSLSHRTIDNYCQRVKEKLGCRNKQELVALFSGIFPRI